MSNPDEFLAFGPLGPVRLTGVLDDRDDEEVAEDEATADQQESPADRGDEAVVIDAADVSEVLASIEDEANRTD